jgi:hypothetical protein
MAAEKVEMTEGELKLKTELEAKHGPVYMIRACGLTGWFTEPLLPEVDLFMFEVTDKTKQHIALMGLMRAHLVAPVADYKAFFKARPGAMVPFSSAYGEAVGLTADAHLGK